MLGTLHKHSIIKTSTSPFKPYPLLFLFIFFHGHSIQLIHSQTFIYAGCSQDKYQPNSPYQTNLNSLLSSIAASSHQTLYNSFASGNDSSAPPDTASYGLYQCRADLKTSECSSCIAGAINEMELVCPYTYGGTVQLDACMVRYENTYFLGKMDDSLRYRRCSTSRSSDGEFLRRRDDVLADLEEAVGFRVSRVGAVEGYAQCLGDLSGGDCSSCLSDAVEKVKSMCGSAAAGDVFLAQCYVRYWESGYYDSHPDSSNEDETGKTVAIIVAVIAGVAIIIVLLSLCKRSHAHGK